MEKNRILLVEDDADDEELTIRAIKKGKIVNEIFVARDGQEAIDFIFGPKCFPENGSPNLPRVMLLDLKLPKVSGLQVLQRVRSDPRTKLLPVVVFTSSDREEDLITSYNLGANGFVRKPVDIKEFEEAIMHLSLYWLLVNQPAPLK
jgi:two-component system response regulator